MNKIYKLMSMLVVVLLGLSLAACSDDDLSTNQYAKGVQLNVYGPNPVMRGGVLRFIGSNLDQISQVIIPGCDPITNFEVVKSGSPSEIRVTLPKDGPEVGYVKLIAKDGTEITTKSQLEYEEPIIFDKFSPESVMPGDEITIEGDYLNLVKMVCFNDDVWVSEDDFVSQDRYKLVVKVPEQAQTGVIGLYTMDLTKIDNPAAETGYNIIESEIILEVGTPIVTKFNSPRGEAKPMETVTVKAGETVTITGKFFNLAAGVEFVGEENTVAVTNIKVSEDGNTITFTMPADAPDGQLNIVCKSGVKVPVGSVATVAPDGLKAEPMPVKNGKQLTISGSDLDLIKEVHFPNVADAVQFELNNGKILVTVPEKAQEGDVTLKMENGKEVTVAFTLVKPVVTEYGSNPVNAGAQLRIIGKNLDLVESVSFGEAKSVPDNIENTDTVMTAITVTVPMAATSGKPTLNLKNGTTVEAPDLQIEEATFCYATALPSEEDELKAGNSMTITVANGDVLTKVLMNGEDCQFILTGEEKDQLIIGIPASATKSSTLTLVSSNGEISYDLTIIPATSVKKKLFSGLKELTWNDGGRIAIPAEKFEGVPEGAELTFVYSQVQNEWGAAQINYGNWSGIDFIKDGEYAVTFKQTLVPTDIYGWFEDGVLNRETTVILTQDILDNIQALQGVCEGQNNIGIIIQGQNLVFTGVILSYENSLETTLWEGNEDMGNWGNQPYILSDGGAEFIENKVKAGQTLRFYGTATDSGDWNFQIFEGHWGPQYGDFSAGNNGNELAANGCVSLTVTQAMLDAATSAGGWGGIFVVQGKNFILTKVTVE